VHKRYARATLSINMADFEKILKFMDDSPSVLARAQELHSLTDDDGKTIVDKEAWPPGWNKWSSFTKAWRSLQRRTTVVPEPKQGDQDVAAQGGAVNSGIQGAKVLDKAKDWTLVSHLRTSLRSAHSPWPWLSTPSKVLPLGLNLSRAQVKANPPRRSQKHSPRSFNSASRRQPMSVPWPASTLRA
jgi:hypothetical protein